MWTWDSYFCWGFLEVSLVSATEGLVRNLQNENKKIQMPGQGKGKEEKIPSFMSALIFMSCTLPGLVKVTLTVGANV